MYLTTKIPAGWMMEQKQLKKQAGFIIERGDQATVIIIC